MSTISKPYVKKSSDLSNVLAVFYRVHFEVAGTGVTGLSPTLKITDTAGSNVTPLTESTHWKRTERSNVAGDYEIAIDIAKVSTFGTYTIEVDSTDPGAGKLVTHFTISGVYGKVNDGSATSTSFITDLSSAVNDFYKDSLLLPIDTSALNGSGPRQVTAYTGASKTITVTALPSAPANGDAFYLIRY